MPATLGIPLLLSLVCAHCVPGCRYSRDNANLPAQPAKSGAPAVSESLDDIRAHMAGLVRVEEDRHVISSPAEFDAWRLKALVTLDEVRRREGVDGFQQSPVAKSGSQHGVVDAAAHKIAWRALTCWNPACLGKGKGGGPLVFVKQYENAWIDPGGKLQWKTITDKDLPSPAICPLCGRMEFVRPYDEPEVEFRRQKLEEELRESRRIRAEAEAAGTLVPAGVRTPTEIMKETNELPKLFLTPE